ncbi:hypothetical protein QJS04_geneDACA014309 [Acorus gramineus]|uniref:Secreted protein n=1 Tax=Acorus gramineus TaxID=55184 RepID=A0AAV9A0C1_ACOGR|nr:hypothetical protein QJS04_geneDACA014309 [Acorus gramineus]
MYFSFFVLLACGEREVEYEGRTEQLVQSKRGINVVNEVFQATRSVLYMCQKRASTLYIFPTALCRMSRTLRPVCIGQYPRMLIEL